MSIKIVEEQIVNFLESSRPEVLVIVGKWGVGKTFEWERLTKGHKSDIALKSYSYVSLFGLKNLTEVKDVAFLNAVDTNKIDEGPDIKGYSKRLAKLLKEIKAPYVGGIGSLIGSISQLALHKTVICFDDIERRSDSIKIKDFMGLVSFLKEQKECKIVLLLNKDAGGDTFKEYEDYKEKVIDREINFSPTPEYCFDSTLSGDFPFRGFIREHCISLEIVNRRVLSKIKTHIDEHMVQVQGFDQLIQEQVILGLIVLCWCYYCHGADKKNIPSLEYALYDTSMHFHDIADNDDTTNKEWDKKLSVLDYTFSQTLKIVLGRSITDGFVTADLLLPVCRELQQAIDIEKNNEELRKAWELFHHSFENNEEAIVTAFDIGLRKVASDVSMYQYSQGIGVLRTLNRDEHANELIDLFIVQNRDNVEKLRAVHDGAFPINDKEIIARVDKALNEIEPPPTVDVILEKRRGTNSYDHKEAEILSKLTEEEIFERFMSWQGAELTDYVRVFMLLSGGSVELSRKVDSVFKRISETSSLNKHRLLKFRK